MSLDGRSPDEIREIIGKNNKRCPDNRGDSCQHSFLIRGIVCCDRKLYGGRDPQPGCLNYMLSPDFDVKATQTKWMCPKKVEYKDCKHRKKAACGLVLFSGRQPDEDCKSYSPRPKKGSLQGVIRLEEVSEDENQA